MSINPPHLSLIGSACSEYNNLNRSVLQCHVVGLAQAAEVVRTCHAEHRPRPAEPAYRASTRYTESNFLLQFGHPYVALDSVIIVIRREVPGESQIIVLARSSRWRFGALCFFISAQERVAVWLTSARITERNKRTWLVSAARSTASRSWLNCP